MIEDVKWLKPEKYNTSGPCWIAKDGKVLKGIFHPDGDIEVIRCLDIEVVNPDGVCERKPNQKKPVLR